MKISTVNFHAIWGDAESNRKRMLEIAEVAGKEGVDLIVFPEVALTGYDGDDTPGREDKMHRRLAETVPGPTSNAMAEVCKKYNMYALFGLPERDSVDKTKVFNSAAICGPEGVIGAYRKIHLPFFEMEWADRGEKPVMFDTPWGPVGIGICYDAYAYPEITRYCRAKGARLFINVSAISTAETKGAGGYTGNISLEYHVQNNSIYLVTSNLCGWDKDSYFMGGASIIGPTVNPLGVHFYAGKRFLDPGADEASVETSIVDLKLTDLSFLSTVFTNYDWRPDKYIEWFQDVLEDPNWKKD